MSDERPDELSSYLAYLPVLFQEDGPDGKPNVLGRFLLAFEEVLTGLRGAAERGLEEMLDGQLRAEPGASPDFETGVQRYFTPGPGVPDERRAPEEFLDWLAGWVALALQPGWEVEEKRRLLARIVPLYAKRGTKEGMEDFLSTYTGLQIGNGVEVREYLHPMQVGVTSRVGKDTRIGETPHYFEVRLILKEARPDRSLRGKQEIARAIIEREKPAHTCYDLLISIPQTIQVGVVSHVGQNTSLGRPEFLPFRS
jgi:Phage tail protein (Tail_P2_I)